MKTCSRCGRERPLADYSRNARMKDGLSSHCRECSAAKWAERKGTVNARRRGAAAPAHDPIPEPDVDLSEVRAPPTHVPAPSARCATDIILSDVHAPDEVDVPAWRCALTMIEALKPERVIILGDFIDGEAFSRHVPVNLKDAVVEFSGSVAYLEQVRRVHAGPLYFFEGNHETWPAKWAAQHAPNIASMLLVEEMLELRRLGITWIPEGRQPYRIATNLLALHGHQLFASMPPKYHARTAILGYAESIVYGHTHRPDYHQTERVPSGVIAAYGLGCLRSLKPAWNKGPARSSSWAHGIGVRERDQAEEGARTRASWALGLGGAGVAVVAGGVVLAASGRSGGFWAVGGGALAVVAGVAVARF